MYNMSDIYCGLSTCTQSLPQNPLLAYSYVPNQCLGSVYSYEKALSSGTLFPVLDKPMCVYGYEFKDECKKENCADKPMCEKEEKCKCGGGDNE